MLFVHKKQTCLLENVFIRRILINDILTISDEMRHICDGSQIRGHSAKEKNQEVVSNRVCSYSFMSKDASGIWTFFHIWQSQTNSLWEYASLTGRFIAIAYFLGRYQLCWNSMARSPACHLCRKKRCNLHPVMKKYIWVSLPRFG